MARLRRADSSGPGLARRGRGRGFEYLDESGAHVDAATAERIRELAIPPAWADVWICPEPNGHIQAVGTDAAGRRQYLYHPDWRRRRDRQKFAEMTRFARVLPELREAAARDLRRRGLVRERVLACAVRLLDRGFFRIGTEGYAAENGSYGLATMQRRHVALEPGGVVRFDYRSKGGKRRVQSVVDSQVLTVVQALKRRRTGTELLAYRSGRAWVDVTSDDINQYIKEATRDTFTAKNFRTWNATVLAAVALAVSSEAHGSKAARTRAISRAVQEVAYYLGNTPTVCRASYIDPRVFDRFRDGLTIGGALAELGEGDRGEPATQGAVEEAVLDLLERDVDSPALERVR
ncbi:MAG: DNA topoisomerase IB [Gaiellaceae bacterium]